MKHTARGLLSLPLVFLLVGLAGCGLDGGETMFGDAGHGDGSGDGSGGDAHTCQAGQWACQGNIARRCDGHGGFTNEMQNCGTSNMTCSPGIGCSVCTPGFNRCDPNNPQQTQRCSDDGTQWLNGPVCDDSQGQVCNSGSCSDRCNPTELTYLGCEYWPTVTVNSQLDPVFQFSVVVANPQTYPVHLSITGGALRSAIDRTLDPGSVQSINLPWVGELSQNNNDSCFNPDPFNPPSFTDCVGHSVLKTGGAYHIQTNGPIAAYQLNPSTFQSGSTFSYTNDASLLLPTRVLTTHYIAVAHDNWTATNPNTGQVEGTLGGFVSIIGVDAAESGTNVTVHLTAAVRAGAGVTASGPGTRTFNLHQGDVVQLVGDAANQDLTGSVIEADHPVAVFTGHDCTNIPSNLVACDHLEEQLFPNETWGKHYAVSQLRDRGPTEHSLIRIVSQRDGNALTFDGIAAPRECPGTLNAGQLCEFQTLGNFQVTGTQPLLVMQYMIGEGDQPQCDPSNPSTSDPACMGDPAMVTEVPMDQFRTSYDFLVPDTYVANFVNIVIPDGSSVSLDGVQMSASSSNVDVLGTGYHVVFAPVAAGRHHIESATGNGFGIKVYGVAPYTSYMYPGGLDLQQISPPG